MQSKLLDDIWQVCHSEYRGESKSRALKMLGKMKPFEGGVTLSKLDLFVVDFRKKYQIGSVMITRQVTRSSNCWYVTFSVGDSVSEYHTIQAVSLDEAYVKLCLSLFRGVKLGEYKCRRSRR